MTEAIRDGNHVTVALGVSSASATTTLPLTIDSATGRLLTNSASGSGDVVGPASATDNAIASFDSTTGKLIQNSAVTIADTTGVIAGTEGITLSGTTSGTTAVVATAVAGTTTLTLPAATDTLVGKATTDTFTNKTFDANGTGNSISNVDLSADVTGNLPVGNLNSGTSASSSTFWRGDGTWAAPAGGGDVVGPASATDAVPVLFDGTTGKLIKNSTPTGTGNPVLATSPTLVTPALGTPSSGTLTNATGLPISTGVSGLGTGVATFLATPSSANLASAVTDETGSGALVFGTSPTLVTPALGTPTSGTLTNTTGYPGDSSLVTTGALNSGSITSGFGAIDNGASNITTTGDISGGTVNATGDTSAGDNSALGYTATEGAILTGQGSTNDVTIKNDADETILAIPTGTNDVVFGVDGAEGALILAEKTSVQLDPAGGADGDYSGITVTGTGGATIAFGDTVYLAVADSRWELTDASAVATAGTPLVGIAVTSSTDGNPITVLLHGIIRADAKFPTFTVGAQVFLSETAGLLTNTAPTTTDAVVRAVGFATTANEVYWNCSPDYITHV